MDTHDRIHAEAEAEYLENGGALSIERRDHYFARAMTALAAAEAAARSPLAAPIDVATLIAKHTDKDGYANTDDMELFAADLLKAAAPSHIEPK